MHHSDYGFSLLFTLMAPLQIYVKKSNINILIIFIYGQI